MNGCNENAIEFMTNGTKATLTFSQGRYKSVIRKLYVFELRSHRACQNDGVYRQLELGKRLGKFGFVGLAQRQQEFLVLMFDYQFDE